MYFIFLIFFTLVRKSFANDIFEENIRSTCVLPEPFWDAYHFLSDQKDIQIIVFKNDSIDILNEIILQIDIPLVILDLFLHTPMKIEVPDDYNIFKGSKYIRHKEVNILILITEINDLINIKLYTLNVDDKIMIIFDLRYLICINETIFKQIATNILKRLWDYREIIQV